MALQCRAHLPALLLLLLMVALCGPAVAVVRVQPGGDDGMPLQGSSGAASVRRAGDISQATSSDCSDLIVELIDKPAVAYAAQLNMKSSSGGGRPVSSATLASPAVAQYAARLKAQANAVATRTLGGTARISAYYQFAFAGFFVKCVTGKELQALKKDPGVAAVTPNSFAQPATITTPGFLGLDAPGGVWSQLGGTANAGDGIVIGVLDGGYWPESPSFSDQTDPNSNSGGSVYEPLPRFRGTCDSGSEPASVMCNNKVLACRHFFEGLAASGDELLAKYSYEYLNCRDSNGHGTHTASTAAGNSGAATDFNTTAKMSGMAPKARLAIYKVCWGRPSAICPASATLSAVDAAVTDGVDVISYSNTGTDSDLQDPVQKAFMGAAMANVFVAAAGGNTDTSGNERRVQHPGPWVTTVAASTHDRVLSASVVLGDGSQWTGTGLFEPSTLPPLPLILAEDAGLAGANADDLRFCINGTLDPEKARGKVVVCDRGGRISARYLKSTVVAAANGAGMILVNINANNLVGTDHYSVPTVHLPVEARAALRAYAGGGAGAQATLASAITKDASAPQVAAFSLEGPITAARSELLKPDLTAPGKDILAAVAPPGNLGFKTDFKEGTSMATPHVSGAAALLKSLHRDWSPMMIKSALMTTAYQTNKLGQAVGTAFEMGAGHIDPSAAVNPGLVFDSNSQDWQRVVCGSQTSAEAWPQICLECLQAPALCEPQQLNLASVSAANVVGQARINRTATSVLSAAAEFTVTITQPPGFDVTVAPDIFTLQPGDSVLLSINIRHVDAAIGAFSSGAIVWTSSQGTVTRIPVVARAPNLAVFHPTELRFAAPNRTRRFSVPVQTGFAGSFHSLAIGLQPPRVFQGSVSQDPDRSFSPSDASGTARVDFSVPQGSTWAYLRTALFNSDLSAQGIDLDLYLYDSSGRRVGSSVNSGSDEQVSVAMPSATSYTAFVHGYKVPAGSSAQFKLYVWVLRLPSPGSSNARAVPSAASPITVSAGDQVNVSVVLNDRLLQPTQKWLGALLFAGTSAERAPVPEMTLLSLV